MNERIPLSFLFAERKDEDPPVEPIPGFAVFYNEELWRLKSTLDRTAVLEDVTDRYRTVTARFEYVAVDPAVVEWRPKTADPNDPTLWRRSPGGRPRKPAKDLLTGDERALASQQRAQEREENERAELRRRSAQLAIHQAEPVIEVAAVEPPAPTLVGLCVKCGASGRLNDEGICQRHQPRAKRSEKGVHKIATDFTPSASAESPLKTEAAEPQPARVITRAPRHRTRPEGCLRRCRPFRDDTYHAPGCPHRIEQLARFNRKAPPTAGCRACEQPGTGVRHAVGCPHRRGPLSNAEMVAMASGTLRTVDPTTSAPAAESTALAVVDVLPVPALAGLPTRSDWLALLARLRIVKAENDVLKADMRQMVSDLHEVLDS